MKKLLLTLFLIMTGLCSAQNYGPGKARGLFLGTGIGPRFPVSEASKKQNVGVGFNFEFMYTDNEYIPLFIIAKIGYEHYPGAQDLYKHTNYSAFSANVIPISLGAKFFLPPVMEDLNVLLPAVEGSVVLSIFEKYHQFKQGKGADNFVEENSKIGFQLGAGFSMFLMEIMGYYNYYLNNEYLSFDARIRIPLFVNF